MIPKTFHDGNPEDRRYVIDYWSWLQDQPQDAWLLWARCANWDNAEAIFDAMIGRPDCDLALVSWLFWRSDPAYFVETPSRYRPGSLIRKIVENANGGLYRSSDLFCDRYETAVQAHRYVQALRRNTSEKPPFALPRVLCGPFNGRPAVLPARYDDQTEADLAEIFRYLNGGLPRSEKEHWLSQTKGGNVWLKDRMRLPDVSAAQLASFHHLDDAAYVEAIYGRSSDFDAALAKERGGAKVRRSWWPFGS
jgi:hypothetical protein